MMNPNAKNNLWYWIFTTLFAALMVFSAIPSVLVTHDSVKIIHDYMGFPVYFIPFTGVAKMLGVIAILVPGFKRLKEWAYAGLFFDLAGAIYASIALSPKFDPEILFLLVWVIPGILSYLYWNRKLLNS